MTFTKGIGSPSYMAPEVLNKEHYKKPADIYAFAITMLEVFTWNEAYPKSQFRFPWMIAEFVTKGQRLNLDIVEPSVKKIIEMCWQQYPTERLKIEDVVALLETEYIKQN